ncbi:hypothetical protein ACTXG7_19425 [Mycolicibacterium sp. Dal123E01]
MDQRRQHFEATDVLEPEFSKIGVELNDAAREVIGALFEDTVQRRSASGA